VIIGRRRICPRGSRSQFWVVAPAVFLFLLHDTGEIKRGFLRTVPNRLFEPALAILTDLDRALGGYVRGVFLESSALGISVALLLAILGVPINWAILIGLVSGTANPVPCIGLANRPPLAEASLQRAALNASLAHRQNFSAAGLSLPLREIIPNGTRLGSGVRGISFTRLPKA